MSFKKICAALIVALLEAASVSNARNLKSDIQAYPGIQFQVEQTFLDLLSEEFFYQLPYIVNDVLAPLVPKEIRLFLGFFQIREIAVRNFQIDTERSHFTIDPKKDGVMMNWAKIKSWNIHFECLYIVVWPIEYYFNVDINFKEATLDNGLSLKADPHTGRPIVNFFDTYFNLAQSYVHFSGDFVIEIIGWLTNFLKVPVQILVNEFFQPIVNVAINDFIIPIFLESGLLKFNTNINGKLDTLYADITIPQAPIYDNNTMDIFTDGAVYFQSEGRKYASPSTPMKFQLNDNNLQLVLSSYSINQLVETVIATELLSVPVNHHTIAELFGVELTTTLLFPVIPQLFYHYGHRNVSLLIKPLTGTVIDWKSESKDTQVKANTLASWIIHDDPFSINSTKKNGGSVIEVAFDSIMNLDIALELNINATKHVDLSINSLSLSGFNVTKDYIGGSIKSDEQGIFYRLSGSMIFIRAALNSIISGLNIVLPELNLIDYMISFNYQDSALGTGINVTKKQQPKTQ